MPTPPAHPYLAHPLPRAFAHRGWHLDELADMENSLSAFRRAVQEGYHYIETDVHSTSDGVLVVHHDPSLERMTDGVGPIAAQRWDQIRPAKVSGREPIPRLEDVLEELPDAAFNIDVKADAAVTPLVQTIQRTGAFDRVAVASFSDTRLRRVRRLAGPKLATALGPRAVGVLRLGASLHLPHPGQFIRGAMAQVPLAWGRFTIVENTFLRAALRAGVEVHTWTVNDPERMRGLLEHGVDGIVTDRPDRLREILLERGEWHRRPLK